MPTLLLTWNQKREYRVNIPTASPVEQGSIMANAIMEALSSLSTNNLHSVIPESITFTVQED